MGNTGQKGTYHRRTEDGVVQARNLGQLLHAEEGGNRGGGGDEIHFWK